MIRTTLGSIFLEPEDLAFFDLGFEARVVLDFLTLLFLRVLAFNVFDLAGIPSISLKRKCSKY